MFIISLDVSFRNTGMSVYDEVGRCFYFGTCRSSQKEVKTFKSVVRSAVELVANIQCLLTYLSSFCSSGNSIFLVESPPPASVYSAGLWSLTGAVSSFLLMRGVKGFSCSPLLIKHLLGSRVASKQDSIELASKLYTNIVNQHASVGKPLKFGQVSFVEDINNFGVSNRIVINSFSPEILKDHDVCESFIILANFLEAVEWDFLSNVEKDLTTFKYTRI